MLLARVEAWFKNQDGSTAVPRRLLYDYGRRETRSYVVAMLLGLVVAACTAVTTYLLGKAANEIVVNYNYPAIVALSFVVIILFTARGLATYGSSIILARVSNRLAAELQQQAFDKLLVHGLAFFAQKHSSEFVHRVTRGSTAAVKTLETVVNALGRDVPMLIGLSAVMVWQQPLLSIIGLVSMPIAAVAIRGLARRTRALASAELKDTRFILETLQETLRGFKVVKSFTLERAMQKRIGKAIKGVEQRQNKLARVQNRASPLMEALGGISIALVLLYGGYVMLERKAPPGEFISFIAAFLLAYEPAKRLAKVNIDLARSIRGAEELFDILDSAPSEPEEPQLSNRHIDKGEINFANVNFSYMPDQPVLRDVTFTAQANKMTAFVGHSGGGKSTIISLIMRFYDIADGRIEIDGVDIHQIPRRVLRSQIAYVGQDVFLFRGTIRENILFGKPGATDDDVIAAAKAAYAHDFIMSFPDGYDADVGEAGATLSSGQRQRIAVARALIRNATIILLDEATSALDSKSEYEVQLAIERLREGRTCIAVAHRLHTIAHADLICVIEEGRIIERGTHAELMARNGFFAEMFQLQSMNAS